MLPLYSQLQNLLAYAKTYKHLDDNIEQSIVEKEARLRDKHKYHAVNLIPKEILSIYQINTHTGHKLATIVSKFLFI